MSRWTMAIPTSPTPLSTVVNRQKKVSYIKVNTSGTPIPGVEFSLFKADTMEKVETAISDKNGVFTFSQFDYGDWDHPGDGCAGGYCRMEDIRLHVGDDWTQPEPILCVNIPDHYAFLKTDSSGVPLPGVKFTVEDASGKSIGTYESNEDGIVSIRALSRANTSSRRSRRLRDTASPAKSSGSRSTSTTLCPIR